MNFKKQYLFFSFIFLSIFSFGKISKQDSLLRIWKNHSFTDSIRVKALKYFLNVAAYNDPKTSLVLCSEFEVLAKKNNNIKWLGDLNLYKAICNVTLSNYPEARNYFDLSLKILSTTTDNLLTGEVFMAMAQMNSKLGQPDSAIINFNNALKWFQKSNDSLNIARVYNQLAYAHYRMADYVGALNFNHTALKYADSLKRKEMYAYILLAIGDIYIDQKENELAKNYFKRAILIQKNSGNLSGLSYSVNDLSIVYFEEKNYPKALEGFREFLKLCLITQDAAGIMLAKTNIGKTFSWMNLVDSALYYETDALKLAVQGGDPKDISYCYNVMGDIYFRKKDYNKSLNNFTNALNLLSKDGVIYVLKDTYEGLYKTYNAKGDISNAFKFYQNYIAIRDSMNNETNVRELTKKEVSFKFIKAALTDSIRNVEKAAQEKFKHEQEIQKQKTYTYSGIFGLFLMIIVAAVSFRAYKQKQKANVIISEQKHLVEEKQKEILDSIHYAKRIQTALITNEKYIDKKLNQLATNKTEENKK